MFERKPSLFTMAWSLALRSFYLGQRSPLTYSFQVSRESELAFLLRSLINALLLLLLLQSALPRQPVPRLQDTIRKYLHTVRPLLTKDEFARTEKEAASFMQSGRARKSQALLVLKSWFAGNYVSDWLEKYVYLRSRAPLLINSNYYGLGYAYHIPSQVQTARAALLAHNFARFKNLLESERLSPTTMRGTVPVCMRQYERMFGLTRVPGRDMDWLQHCDSLHVAVAHKGAWWRVELLRDDKTPLAVEAIKYQLDIITASCRHLSGADPAPASLRYSDAEAKLPALTALGRTRWAEIREDHFRCVFKRARFQTEKSPVSGS